MWREYPLVFGHFVFSTLRVSGPHDGRHFVNHIVNQNDKSYQTPKPSIIDRRLFYQKMKSYKIETPPILIHAGRKSHDIFVTNSDRLYWWDSTILRLMLTVKDRAKLVVERAMRIVKRKSRYRGGVWWGRGGFLETNTICETTLRDTPKPMLPCST